MNNDSLHTKFQVLRHIVASAAESELGLLFHYGKTTIPLSTTLKELRHQQTQTHIEVVNSTMKQKYKSMEMRFYWVKYQTRQGHFFIYWGPGTTSKADFFTKNHPPSHHTPMRH